MGETTPKTAMFNSLMRTCGTNRMTCRYISTYSRGKTGVSRKGRKFNALHLLAVSDRWIWINSNVIFVGQIVIHSDNNKTFSSLCFVNITLPVSTCKMEYIKITCFFRFHLLANVSFIQIIFRRTEKKS